MHMAMAMRIPRIIISLRRIVCIRNGTPSDLGI